MYTLSSDQAVRSEKRPKVQNKTNIFDVANRVDVAIADIRADEGGTRSISVVSFCDVAMLIGRTRAYCHLRSDINK